MGSHRIEARSTVAWMLQSGCCMQERDIEAIPGISKASIAEIRAYRERFMGDGFSS